MRGGWLTVKVEGAVLGVEGVRALPKLGSLNLFSVAGEYFETAWGNSLSIINGNIYALC